MAIEVVGRDESVSKEVSCVGCGSRLRYFESDVQTYQDRDWTGDSDTVRYVPCPNCDHRVRVR